MKKTDLNNTYPQIQSYRNYWKDNHKPRKLTVPTETKETDKLTPTKPKEGKHTHYHRKISGIDNHWAQFTYKKPQAKKMDTKAGAILLLYTRNTLQPQRQILPQSKGLGKDFPIKWTNKISGCSYHNI